MSGGQKSFVSTLNYHCAGSILFVFLMYKDPHCNVAEYIRTKIFFNFSGSTALCLQLLSIYRPQYCLVGYTNLQGNKYLKFSKGGNWRCDVEENGNTQAKYHIIHQYLNKLY